MINKNYTIYDSTGKIIQVGYCQEDILPLILENFPNHFMIEERSDPVTDTVDTVNKQILKNTKPLETLNYVQARIQSYPSITEQLDMLWHAMNSGTIPKAEPFYSIIKDVKDTFPKGTDGHLDNATYTTIID